MPQVKEKEAQEIVQFNHVGNKQLNEITASYHKDGFDTRLVRPYKEEQMKRQGWQRAKTEDGKDIQVGVDEGAVILMVAAPAKEEKKSAAPAKDDKKSADADKKQTASASSSGNGSTGKK